MPYLSQVGDHCFFSAFFVSVVADHHIHPEEASAATMMMTEDPWEAFGNSSDDDDSSDDAADEPPHRIASFLAQRFLTADPTLPLAERRLLFVRVLQQQCRPNNGEDEKDGNNNDEKRWKEALASKQMTHLVTVRLGLVHVITRFVLLLTSPSASISMLEETGAAEDKSCDDMVVSVLAAL